MFLCPCLFLSFSCLVWTTPHVFFRSVWSVAHRGSSATHKGNSLPAFVEAVRVGADVIELDVVLCKTGEVGGWLGGWLVRKETC